MSKLVYTPNTPFNMSDWESRTDIVSIAAGRNCAMAILQDRTVLKKTYPDSEDLKSYDITELSGRDHLLFQNDSSPEYLAQLSLSPENGWNRIKQLAISHFVSRVVVGLREDGSCIVHVDREKGCDCGRAVIAYTRVDRIRDISEIAVSDAMFALQRNGDVFHFSFYAPDDYYRVNDWHNVKHIVTGAQNSVFGITHDGRVLCAGANCNDDVHKRLSQETDIMDICTTGSEGEWLVLLHRDGTVSSPNASTSLRTRLSEVNKYRFVKLYGHFYHTAYGLTEDRSLIPLFSPLSGGDNEVVSGWSSVRSFAIGQKRFSSPFAIAVLD